VFLFCELIKHVFSTDPSWVVEKSVLWRSGPVETGDRGLYSDRPSGLFRIVRGNRLGPDRHRTGRDRPIIPSVQIRWTAVLAAFGRFSAGL
jgi:hypothetical protein